MLKCNIKREGHIQVKTSGTAQDLMVETSVLIHTIYRNINQKNPEAAKGYRSHLMGLLLDPKSPVWQTDDNK